MKPEKIPVPNTDFFGWNYEQQTQVKHKVNTSYKIDSDHFNLNN